MPTLRALKLIWLCGATLTTKSMYSIQAKNDVFSYAVTDNETGKVEVFKLKAKTYRGAQFEIEGIILFGKSVVIGHHFDKGRTVNVNPNKQI